MEGTSAPADDGTLGGAEVPATISLEDRVAALEKKLAKLMEGMKVALED